MTKLFDERILGVCRICGKAVKIAWALVPNHLWHVTEKCDHIIYTSGSYSALTNLEALLNTILTTREAGEILDIGVHGVIKAITRGLLRGAVKLVEGRRGIWAIPLDAVLLYQKERRPAGWPRKAVADE